MAGPTANAYIIEIGEEAVGLIERRKCRYCFYAAKRSFRALEGQMFASPKRAQSAALNLHRQSSTPQFPFTLLKVDPGN